MGWVDSGRKAELPKDWARRRSKVLRRDGWQCKARLTDGGRCPEKATDVDHIRRGNNHHEKNLQSLCGWHHAKKSAAEGAAARIEDFKRRAKISHLPREDHPGAA